MARANRGCNRRRHFAQGGVSTIRASQTRPGGFIERNAKQDSRHGVDHGFKYVFHCLDEVALAQQDIGPFGERQPYGVQIEHTLYRNLQ